MKNLALIGTAACGLLVLPNSAFSQGTAFTYQGRLWNGSTPASGSYDFTFALFGGFSTNANQLGGTLTNLETVVTSGLFTVALDFGPVFIGNPAWLAIGVRTNGSSTFTVLNPLQALTPEPYAIYAPTAGSATRAGSVAGTNITGTLLPAQLPSAVITNGASSVVLSGTFSGNGSGLSGVGLLAGDNNFNGTQIMSNSFAFTTNTAWVVGCPSNGANVGPYTYEGFLPANITNTYGITNLLNCWTNINGYWLVNDPEGVVLGAQWGVDGFADLTVEDNDWTIVQTNLSQSDLYLGTWSPNSVGAAGPAYVVFGNGSNMAPALSVGGNSNLPFSLQVNGNVSVTGTLSVGSLIGLSWLGAIAPWVGYLGGTNPAVEIMTGTNQGSFAVGASGNTTEQSVGSGSALWGLPPTEPVWQRQPKPEVFLFSTRNALSEWGRGNTCENFVTNFVLYFLTNNLIRAYTNAGLDVVAAIDIPWQGQRDVMNQMSWDTNNFPHGMPAMIAWLHSVGVHIGLLVNWTAQGGTPSLFWQSGIATNCAANIGPDTINQDMAAFYGWGMGQGDTVIWGDGTAADPFTRFQNPAFYEQMLRTIDAATAAPNGIDPIVFGRRPMEVTAFLEPNIGWPEGCPTPAEQMAMVNNRFDDQNTPTGPGLYPIDVALYQQRFIYTNYAVYGGPGHRCSWGCGGDFVPPLNAIDEMAQMATWANSLTTWTWFQTNDLTTAAAPYYTNTAALQIVADSLQQPAFPYYDAGAGSTSVWVKPLIGGAYSIEMANQTESTVTMNFSWATNVCSPPGWIPLGSTTYPLSIGANQIFTAYDVVNGVQYGTFSSVFSTNVAAHSIAWLVLRPAGQSGAFAGNGAGLTDIPNTAIIGGAITNYESGVTLSGTFNGNGAGLAGVNAANATNFYGLGTNAFDLAGTAATAVMQATQALWGAALALAKSGDLRTAETAAPATDSLKIAPPKGGTAQNWTAITNNGIPIITWRGAGAPDMLAPNGALCNSTSGHLFIMSTNAWHRIW